MGLDACVYCDCLENQEREGSLPTDIHIEVQENGMPLICDTTGPIHENNPRWEDFYCEHPDRKFLDHHLGNITSVGLIRHELERERDRFALLLGKVVYNVSHAGDWPSLEAIAELEPELAEIEAFKCVGNVPGAWAPRALWRLFCLGRHHYTSAAEADSFMRTFRRRMLDLVETARKIGKPIAF